MPSFVRRHKKKLVALAVLAIAPFAAHLVVGATTRITPPDQTGAFFVGLPAILAITVALSPRAKTLTGTTFKAVTFGLLLSGVLVGEGFVCIVMAAPLFVWYSQRRLPVAGSNATNSPTYLYPGASFALTRFIP